MLERVALGQNRFNVPGVGADPRGVALGQRIAAVFPTIDRVVAFFRAYTAEQSLGDVLSSLQLLQVETPHRTRELLVSFPAQSSHAADGIAKTARLVGGAAYTGSARHFVQYRDDASPLGYDSGNLERGECDFAVYGHSFTQTYRKVQELDFGALVRRLAPLPERPRPRLPDEPPEPPPPVLWLLVRTGLGAAVRGYLWRNGVRASLAAVTPASTGAFDELAQGAGDLLLFRVTGLPDRMLALFRRMPGVRLFDPLGPNFAVQLGWRHPFALQSCAGVFAQDRLYLFSGEDRRVIETGSLPAYVPIEQLGQPAAADGGAGPQAQRSVMTPRPLGAAESASLGLDLRLLPSAQAPGAIAGTIVPKAQWTWLKRLVHALPTALLHGYRVALTPDYAVLLCSEDADMVPLGTFLEAMSAHVYVPRGWRLFPQVTPEVLFQHVGGRSEHLYFFLPGAPAPFFLPATAFVPLERRALAAIDVDEALVARLLPAATAPDLVNEPVGAVAAWTRRLGTPPGSEA